LPELYTSLSLLVRGGEASWSREFGFSQKVLIVCNLSKFVTPQGRFFSASAIEFVIQFPAILLLHMVDSEGDSDTDTDSEALRTIQPV
jgi:hypothetical protein